MAVHSTYQSEIDMVDDTKTLVFVTDAVNYDLNEWSYDGLTITGYDEVAHEHGAAALLYEMGFRHYGPSEKYIKRPTEIATDLSAPKQTRWMPYNNMFYAYGIEGGNGRERYSSLRGTLTAEWRKFQQMHNCATDHIPAGHRWSGIIVDTTFGRAFFNANLDMLNPDKPKPDSGSAGCTFNLAVAEPQYSRLVHYCAAFLLYSGLNRYHRTNFDASDGDANPTNLTWKFAKDVAAKMRAGTTEIGGIPAQAGVPDAAIGVYAYGTHRMPPDIETLPGVYTQVALAFNRTPFPNLDFVKWFGAKSDFVAIREYLDTMTWSYGIPQNNYRVTRKYLGNNYPAFKAAGALGVNSEYAANTLANMIGTYTFCRHLTTGETATTIYDQTIIDVVRDIFDNDPAVARLFTVWGSGRADFNKYALYNWFSIVNDMQDSWYKTDFEAYMTIMYKYYFLPSKPMPSPAPTSVAALNTWKAANAVRIAEYQDAFTSLMANIQYVQPEHWLHCYAFMRRLANSVVASPFRAGRAYVKAQAAIPAYYDTRGRLQPAVPAVAEVSAIEEIPNPHLNLYMFYYTYRAAREGFFDPNNYGIWAPYRPERLEKPPGGPATWWDAPFPPTHEEFLERLAILQQIAYRPEELLSGDLVVMKVTPQSGASDRNPLARIRVGGTSRFVFAGPGTAVFDQDASAPIQASVTGPAISLSRYHAHESASAGDLVGTLSVTIPSPTQATVVSGPIIKSSAYVIAESSSIGTLIGTLSVSGGSGTYTYSITLDADNKFELDAATNSRLELKNTLNYATKRYHDVTISALSNAVGATPVVRVLTIAVSPTTSRWTYSITADPDSKFVLDGTVNTRLELENTLDYGTATSHLVTIQANDGVYTPLSRQLTINVGQRIEVAYGPGIHYISQTFVGAGFASASDGGKIFLRVFPTYDFPYYVSSIDGSVDLWMYVPKEIGDFGRAEILNDGGRTSVYWATGNLDIVSSTPATALAAIPSGQLRLFMGEPKTRGESVFGNVNQFLSPYPDFALMPRELAVVDFPSSLVSITVPEFAGSDDLDDPTKDEDTEEEPTET